MSLFMLLQLQAVVCLKAALIALQLILKMSMTAEDVSREVPFIFECFRAEVAWIQSKFGRCVEDFRCIVALRYLKNELFCMNLNVTLEIGDNFEVGIANGTFKLAWMMKI